MICLEGDEEIACPGCGMHCISISDNPLVDLNGDLMIPFRCESCAIVAHLHLRFHKGSTIVGWTL